MSSAVLESVSSLHKHLRDVPAAAAAASRLLHDRRMSALWKALDAGRDITLRPVAAPGRTRLFSLKFACDAGRFDVAIASADDAGMTIAAAADLGQSLRSLAALALFGELTQRLRQGVLPGVEAVSVEPLALEDSPCAGWCALRRDGVELARIAVQQLPSEVHERLRGAARPDGRRGAWRDVLRLPGQVGVASRALSVTLLRSLAVGDVLLLPLAALEGAAATLWLGALDGPGLVASGVVEADTFTISGALHMMDEDPAFAADAEVAPDSLGSLELPVRFELETVSVSLADLEAIQPGYVIELAMPVAEASLRLVSCGHVIGHADLVSVSGRLGARITRLVARDDSDQHHG